MAVLLSVFALLTLFLSGSVVFDLFGIRAKEGDYVLHVVWANFTSSLLYLVAVYGLVIHIDQGGLYETKTTGAMVFRISITLVFTFFCYHRLKKEKQNAL